MISGACCVFRSSLVTRYSSLITHYSSRFILHLYPRKYKISFKYSVHVSRNSSWLCHQASGRYQLGLAGWTEMVMSVPCKASRKDIYARRVWNGSVTMINAWKPRSSANRRTARASSYVVLTISGAIRICSSGTPCQIASVRINST